MRRENWNAETPKCVLNLSQLYEGTVRPKSFTDFNFPFVFMDHEMFCVRMPREGPDPPPWLPSYIASLQKLLL